MTVKKTGVAKAPGSTGSLEQDKSIAPGRNMPTMETIFSWPGQPEVFEPDMLNATTDPTQQEAFGQVNVRVWLGHLTSIFRHKAASFAGRHGGEQAIVYTDTYNLVGHPFESEQYCQQGFGKNCPALADPEVAQVNAAFADIVIARDMIYGVLAGRVPPFALGTLGYRVQGKKAPWE